MRTETYNFEDMEDTQWIKVLGKPVMIGVYRNADDSVISQLATTLIAVSFDPVGRTKIVGSGDSTGWFDPKLAYALISFQED